MFQVAERNSTILLTTTLLFLVIIKEIAAPSTARNVLHLKLCTLFSIKSYFAFLMLDKKKECPEI